MDSDYGRIERTIRYLEEHVYDQPGLEELAAQLHLSPFHFQRLFTRWAGVSPKRFLQFLTLEHAKRLLQTNSSQLEAAYESGLSSPSRLHDLFVAVDAVTPGEYRQLGSGLRIAYGVHPSPFGDCLVGLTERGVCALSFLAAGGSETAVREMSARWAGARLEENPKRTEAMVRRIFDPPPTTNRSPIPLLLKGTNFQIKVWEALLRIPPGTVISYHGLARTVGNPRADRAVGSAVGANPVAYLIPCHRVIRSSGVFGNYRYGSTRKTAMLGWEQARLGRAG